MQSHSYMCSTNILHNKVYLKIIPKINLSFYKGLKYVTSNSSNSRTFAFLENKNTEQNFNFLQNFLVP